MIYSFACLDQYRLNQECNKLLNTLEYDELFKFDASDVDEGELLQELCTTSLFGKKCIVISSPIFLQNDFKFTYKDDFLNFFKKPNEDVILILLINFIYEKNNDFIKLIKNIKILPDLEDKDLNVIVKGMLDDYKIDDFALEELTKRCKDILSVSNEIEKLKLYCDDKYIKFDDVVLLVTEDLDKKLFELTKYYFEKNKKLLMATYYDIIKDSQSKEKKKNDIHMAILSTFSNKAIDLYYAKQFFKLGSDSLAEQLGIKKGLAYYLMQDSKKISDKELSNLITRLSKLDFDLKTTTRDKNLSLELFLLE